jgi:hypothetical protein
VDFLHSVDARAPEGLRERVTALAGEGSRRSWLPLPAAAARRPLLAGALGACLAALAAVLVLVLSGGSSSGNGGGRLTVQRAAALTLRSSTQPAPSESSRRRAQLAASVDGVAFPYWEERFGWRSSGARTDRIDGRYVTTVFYSDWRGRRIGYAIVAGSPAPSLGGGAVAWRGGVEYRFTKADGSQVVAWLRDGHLCVIAGRDVGRGTLLRLASWHDGPAVRA